MHDIEIDISIDFAKLKKFNERRLETVMQKYNLRKIDLEIILLLSKSKDINTAKDITMTELFTKGHISQSVKRLRENGYITIAPDENDLRIQKLKVTKKTNDIVKHVDKIREELAHDLFKGLDESQMIQVRDIFDKMCENIKSIVD